MLTEEAQSLPHLMHMFQLILRHADLFYASRGQFLPQMVNSLQRLGLPGSATSEQRRLSLDLVALVIRWEKARIAAAAAPPTTSPPAAAAAEQQGGGGSPSVGVKRARDSEVNPNPDLDPEIQGQQRQEWGGSGGATATAAAAAAGNEPALKSPRVDEGDAGHMHAEHVAPLAAQLPGYPPAAQLPGCAGGASMVMPPAPPAAPPGPPAVPAPAAEPVLLPSAQPPQAGSLAVADERGGVAGIPGLGAGRLSGGYPHLDP